MVSIDKIPEPETIRRIRRDANLRQEDFAARLNVSRITVIRWERGQRRPHHMILGKLNQLLEELSKS